MRRALAALLLTFAALAVRAEEPLILDVRESRVVAQGGATAAYTLDANVAEAVVQAGTATVIARTAGATQLVVVSGASVRSVQLIVRTRRAAGIAAKNASDRAGDGGSIATHYSSSRGEVQTEISTSARSGNREQKTDVTIVRGGAVTGRAAVASAAYSVATPSTKVTLLDEQVHVAPIVVEQQVVRGVHVESHGLQVHAGVTAPTFIDGFVLPMQRQFVAAASYAWKLAPSVTLEPSLIATRGQAIASLLARYDRGEALQLAGELAHGKGTAAGLTVFANGATQKLALDAAWQPRGFVTASPYDRRGLTASGAWSATFGPRVLATARGSIDDALFARGEQHARTGSAELRVRATKALSLFGGVSHGSFDAGVRSTTIPVGATLDLRRFGLTALTRLGDQTLNGRSRGYRVSARGAMGSVSASAFVDSETNAPTLALIFRERPDLELLLQQLGLSASSPDDIARILRDHADLIDAGIIRSATVNISPRRTQAGLDVAWLGERQSLRLRLLRNRIESIASTSTFTTAALSWSRRLSDLTAFDLTAGVWTINGRSRNVFEASLRHAFDGLPSFGGGTISGNVFADDDLTGSGSGLANVVIQLDASTTTRTDAGGNFAFNGVSAKPHSVTAFLPNHDSYFTTPSRVDAAAGDRISFGVARTPARVNGRVVSDAGTPVSGVTLTLARGAQSFTAVSDSSGEFAFVAAPGDWTLAVDAQSLPPGFDASGLAPQSVLLSRSAVAAPRLAVRAIRTISGHATTKCASAIGIDVLPQGRRVETDRDGSFVIRNLPAGKITLVAGANASSVELPDGPALIRDLRLDARCDSPHFGQLSTH